VGTRPPVLSRDTPRQSAPASLLSRRVDFVSGVCTLSVLMDPLDKNRNPVIIPKTEEKKRGCPKCGSMNFNGRRIQGVITYHCRDCKAEFGGGLPQEPLDPRLPHPPANPVPPALQFTKTDRGAIVEERRPVSLTTEFRKGALIPPPGEEDV